MNDNELLAEYQSYGVRLRNYNSANTVDDWVIFNLELADKIATKSKDPSSKFGCVITDTKYRPLGYGLNGFPRKFKDLPERWNDRAFKYRHVIHAEENAILNSHGDLEGAWAFVNGCPCSSCMGKLAQKGIVKVYCWEPTEDYLSRWSIAEPATVASECGIELNFVRRGDES